MQLDYRTGNSKHFVTRWVADKLPKDAVLHGIRWFGTDGKLYGGEDGRCIIAYEGKRIIGLFRFTYSRHIQHTHYLDAMGTWVDPDFRREGVARKMWEIAFEKFSITRVCVVCTSKAGLKFVRKLEKKNPEIYFQVTKNLSRIA